MKCQCANGAILPSPDGRLGTNREEASLEYRNAGMICSFFFDEIVLAFSLFYFSIFQLYPIQRVIIFVG